MVVNIEYLNSQIIKNHKNFICSCNEVFYKELYKIAETIRKNCEKTPLILLSGPSGSGKTTTALTIESILDNSGTETHTLSLDNYFFTITDTEKERLARGELDLESPTRVDADLLNEQLLKMINCEKVELPKYDFSAAARTKSGITLERKPGEPVILEGIHALNPDVIQIPDDSTIKIYVSVRTRVKNGTTTLHPSFIRLMRRMIRDNIYRGRSVEETIKMFDSVETGEQKYIMPYKKCSDIDIDTFIPYELSVYKTFLLNKLNKCQNNDEIVEMSNILSSIEKIDENDVPINSLIREFIGNGEYTY